MIQIHHLPTYTLTFIAVQYVHTHTDAELKPLVLYPMHSSDHDYYVCKIQQQRMHIFYCIDMPWHPFSNDIFFFLHYYPILYYLLYCISHTKTDRRRKENIDLFEWLIHATMRVQPIRRVVLNIERSIGSVYRNRIKESGQRHDTYSIERQREGEAMNWRLLSTFTRL